MRYSEDHKARVRARIVAAAGEALRQHGVDGVGIPALMKKVGLTHGGFYAHFKDRDELVAEAVMAAGDETAARVFADNVDMEHAMEAYLSPGHVKHPALGCVVAALGPEGPRQPARVRKAFGHVARGLVKLVQGKLRPGSSAPITDEALLATATMVGAVVLSRVLDDAALVERLLGAARARLVAASAAAQH